MKRAGIGIGLAAMLAAAMVTAASAGSQDERLKEERHFLEQSSKTYSEGQKAGAGKEHGGRRTERPGGPWV